MGRKRKQRGRRKQLRVTTPGGRSQRVPCDGRRHPRGTMLQWDVETPRGREMRWTVVGGGWPFDD